MRDPAEREPAEYEIADKALDSAQDESSCRDVINNFANTARIYNTSFAGWPDEIFFIKKTFKRCIQFFGKAVQHENLRQSLNPILDFIHDKFYQVMERKEFSGEIQALFLKEFTDFLFTYADAISLIELFLKRWHSADETIFFFCKKRTDQVQGEKYSQLSEALRSLDEYHLFMILHLYHRIMGWHATLVELDYSDEDAQSLVKATLVKLDELLIQNFGLLPTHLLFLSLCAKVDAIPRIFFQPLRIELSEALTQARAELRASLPGVLISDIQVCEEANFPQKWDIVLTQWSILDRISQDYYSALRRAAGFHGAKAALETLSSLAVQAFLKTSDPYYDFFKFYADFINSAFSLFAFSNFYYKDTKISRLSAEVKLEVMEAYSKRFLQFETYPDYATAVRLITTCSSFSFLFSEINQTGNFWPLIKANERAFYRLNEGVIISMLDISRRTLLGLPCSQEELASVRTQRDVLLAIHREFDELNEIRMKAAKWYRFPGASMFLQSLKERADRMLQNPECLEIFLRDLKLLFGPELAKLNRFESEIQELYSFFFPIFKKFKENSEERNFFREQFARLAESEFKKTRRDFAPVHKLLKMILLASTQDGLPASVENMRTRFQKVFLTRLQESSDENLEVFGRVIDKEWRAFLSIENMLILILSKISMYRNNAELSTQIAKLDDLVNDISGKAFLQENNINALMILLINHFDSILTNLPNLPKKFLVFENPFKTTLNEIKQRLVNFVEGVNAFDKEFSASAKEAGYNFDGC